MDWSHWVENLRPHEMGGAVKSKAKPLRFPVRNLDRVGMLAVRPRDGVAAVASALARGEAVLGWDEIRVGGAWYSIGRGDLAERIARGEHS